MMKILSPLPARMPHFEAKTRLRLAPVLLAFILIASTATLAHAFKEAVQDTLQKPQTDLPRTRLTVGMHVIDAQVAVRPQEQQIGLMFRKSMPPNEGMLFDFGTSAKRCFWMKNTLIPLTAAFADDKGVIINFADMKPLSEQSHCSAKPARYVLEMNQGWFKKRGIKAGQKITAAKK